MISKLAPRVFIVDFDLLGYSGHYFNQAVGFREAARALGLEARIYIPVAADPGISEDLGARAILPRSLHWRIDKDAVLERFADSHRMLAPLWKELDAEKISERDFLIITSSRPQIIFGVGQWLGGQPSESRPAVFFRFFGPEFFDFENKDFTEVGWAYHFAARILANVPGGNRVFFTVCNKNAVSHLERLTLRPTFLMPAPKYYGAMTSSTAACLSDSAKIYIHANGSGNTPDQINALVQRVLGSRKDVIFLLRFCKHFYRGAAPEEAIDKNLIGNGVRLLPAEQEHTEYLATIDEADMVLLPYDAVEYREKVSGIFCESAAMGKIAVIPAGTWMAGQVLDGQTAGVLFNEISVDHIAAAIDGAMQDRERLHAEAHRRAGPFREHNSCAKNLDRMIELAGQTHDMRLSCVPLVDVRTALGSQHYLREGWSEIEDGFGAWSDGENAELSFTIKPGAKDLIFSAQVLPFLTQGHSRIDVLLTANKVSVAEWSFDERWPSKSDWSWRHAPIPESIASSGEIQLALRICSPASPKELGLSNDRRKLGLALQQFALEPEARGALSTETEAPTTRSKMNLWRRWKWR